MILVTGGTGIVGSHVLLELARSEGRVRVLCRRHADRSPVKRVFAHYGEEANYARVEWVEGDILDMSTLSSAMEGVSHVHHAAAVVSFDPRDAGALYKVNVQGTANVVNAALTAGVQRLCHVSSTAAIGRAPNGELRNEDHAWVDDARTSDYSRSKALAEMEIHRGIAEGLDAVMVNPCVILGPGPEGRSSMTIAERSWKGLSWFPAGSNAFVDARDVAACMVKLMRQGITGERYLLVGENASYQQLFAKFAKAMGKPVPARAAQPWMLNAAWRAERLRTMFFGGTPMVTKATADSAMTKRGYSNAKVQALLGHPFRSLAESVANVSTFVMGAP